MNETIPQRVYLFDTTLRDGAQTRGVDFSLADKSAIAKALDEFGIDYIEGGWPGANPGDTAFFENPPKMQNAKMVGFGMTRRAGRSAENDTGLAILMEASPGALCLVGKTWDLHVEKILQIDKDENLKIIAESVAYSVAHKNETMFDAEHFFDGYKHNAKYALSCIRTAYEAGASWIVLCDTNGGCLPDEIETITKAVAQLIPARCLGIHAHNDTGNAVANSLAAIRAGARQVQGTLNGLGERCGNANLITLIANLAFKTELEIGISDEKLAELTKLSRFLDTRLERLPDDAAPYVGASAFAHKGGLHGAAVAKLPRSYEHIAPEKIGNKRDVVMSNQGGKASLRARLEASSIPIPDEPALTSLLGEIKEREFAGYSYEGADAGLELLILRFFGAFAKLF